MYTLNILYQFFTCSSSFHNIVAFNHFKKLEKDDKQKRDNGDFINMSFLSIGVYMYFHFNKYKVKNNKLRVI
jgi:hypothetical protein